VTGKLSQLLENMTIQEQSEVEAFAVFVLARRKLQETRILTDDISTQELLQLVTASGSFEWLDAKEEDLYSMKDGKAVQWPSTS
jgi:hypothetical protein